MANLFNYLNNEINKGNTLLSKDGTILSVEKVITKLKKEFTRAMNAGEIYDDMSFSIYAQPIIDSDYITLEFILNQLTPAPAEPADPVPFVDDLPMEEPTCDSPDPCTPNEV